LKQTQAIILKVFKSSISSKNNYKTHKSANATRRYCL